MHKPNCFRNRHSASIALLVLWIALTPKFASAQNLLYDIFADGKRIGELALTDRMIGGAGTPVQEIVSHTKLQVKVLFITVFSLDALDTNLVRSDGLVEHHSWSKIDGEEITVHAVRNDSTFVFRLNTAEQKYEFLFPLSSFDCTSFESDRLDHLLPGDTLDLRVLQLDAMVIEDMKFIRMENDSLVVAGQTIACRVFDWSGPTARGHRWYDQDSLDLLIKEDGIDEDGPYSIVLTRYNNDAKSAHAKVGQNDVR